MRVNCSIVLYHTPFSEVQKAITVLRASGVVGKIWLVDNTERRYANDMTINSSTDTVEGCEYIFGHENIGFGRGHNIALEKSLETDADYHIVMNSDLIFEPKVICQLVEFMDAHPDIAHVMPRVLNLDGTDQHLAKRLPTPWDLIQRRLFHSHNCELELPDKGIYDVPYLSGCFMFLRMTALRELKERDGYVFDPRYFLYPEDIDLTRRLHEMYRTVCYSDVTIKHHHARTSYKSLKLSCIHAWNMIKYFWKWR